MNAPTETGWYWAIINEEWEVIFVDIVKCFEENIETAYRNGNECSYYLSDIKQWGERIIKN